MNAATTKEQLIQEFRLRTIREAAARVIAQKGLGGATMQAIADAAGIAKGTIYLYFQSREELLESTANHAFSQLQEEVQEILDQEAPLEEKLRRMFATQLGFFEERRDFFQFFLSVRYPVDPANASRQRRTTYSQHQAFLERLTVLFEDAQKDGEVREMDASRLALLVSEGVIALLLRRLGEDEPPPVEDDVEWMTRVILDGIAHREDPP